MKLSPSLFRKIHKWTGLILGLQFLLWTISGLGMALLDHKEVAGGHAPPESAPPPIPETGGWASAARALGDAQVTAVALRPLLNRQVVEVTTPEGVRLFDAQSGKPLKIDAELAERVAIAAYDGAPRLKRVEPLRELTLAVREHELPIWRVDFDDKQNSSFYVSGATGKLLERRNDSWRLWDFFWMLHNMDYVNRTSFNHPLIVTVAFATVWLAVTGFYLLFATGWRQDLRWVRRRRS